MFSFKWWEFEFNVTFDEIFHFMFFFWRKAQKKKIERLFAPERKPYEIETGECFSTGETVIRISKEKVALSTQEIMPDEVDESSLENIEFDQVKFR